MKQIDERPWVLIKRGLYWRPNAQGYTGILASAGRYSDEESAGYADHGDGTIRMLASEADEVADATYDDIARHYWKGQALLARAELRALRSISEDGK